MFVLGADDPEMREIEKILNSQRQFYVYAMKDGKRVHAGNAYTAEPLNLYKNRIVLIECEPVQLPHNSEIIRIDHHRPNDFGYDLPPSEYWEASSIGQLWRLLHISGKPLQEYKILAAMDHCPAAAIRGECPGVTQDEIIERKVKEISLSTGCTVQSVYRQIDIITLELQNAPIIRIQDCLIRDMRSRDNGVGYSFDLLTTQLAVLAGGFAAILLNRDEENGMKKLTLMGHVSPECVQRFRNGWAREQGLVGIYGCPDRGYAGGYISNGKL